ncbi:MAG TPA: TraR/DksA C4-type zinc finger protein [Candidatus Babeliaceae bacterium]|nr:TraR/DksA C4-type zinc finger protein [Candidatus Babeliaceae bacterium]
MSNVAQIKKKLLARKQELDQDLARLSREKVSDDQVADPTDQASASTLEELNISLQNQELEEYAMILKALDMIEKGTYGTCTDCGQPISEKRLTLFPNATRCLACQELREERF